MLSLLNQCPLTSNPFLFFKNMCVIRAWSMCFPMHVCTIYSALTLKFNYMFKQQAVLLSVCLPNRVLIVKMCTSVGVFVF